MSDKQLNAGIAVLGSIELRRCGTWTVREDEYGICNVKCSECGGEWDFDCIDDVHVFSFHYCPNCGAKMELPND